MNILVGYEYSGIVSNAFYNAGHNVLSCDLLPSESFHNHYTGKIEDIIDNLSPSQYDLGIFFHPCQYLCKAGIHKSIQNPVRMKLSIEAIENVRKLWKLPIKHICIENPVGILNTNFRLPEQITSFNYFGDPYQKEICLWLKNLPILKPTHFVPGTKSVNNHCNSRMSQALKTKIKSKFFNGIAQAMSNQWNYERISAYYELVNTSLFEQNK